MNNSVDTGFLEIAALAMFTLLTTVVFPGWVIPLLSLIVFIFFGIIKSIQGSRKLKMDAERRREETERRSEEKEKRREEKERHNWAKKEHQARMLQIKRSTPGNIES